MSIHQKKHHLPVARTITGAYTLMLTKPTIAAYLNYLHFPFTRQPASGALVLRQSGADCH